MHDACMAHIVFLCLVTPVISGEEYKWIYSCGFQNPPPPPTPNVFFTRLYKKEKEMSDLTSAGYLISEDGTDELVFAVRWYEIMGIILIARWDVILRIFWRYTYEFIIWQAVCCHIILWLLNPGVGLSCVATLVRQLVCSMSAVTFPRQWLFRMLFCTNVPFRRVSLLQLSGWSSETSLHNHGRQHEVCSYCGGMVNDSSLSGMCPLFFGATYWRR